jgi:hypothetical protein
LLATELWRGGCTRTLKNIDRAAILCAVVHVIAADSRGRAVFFLCSYNQRIFIQGQAGAEEFLRSGVGRFDVRVLTPTRAAAREQTHGAGRFRAVVVFVAADSDGGAVFVLGGNGEKAAFEGDLPAEVIIEARVGRLDVRLLCPGRATTCEDVDGANSKTVIVLPAVDPRGIAVLKSRCDRQRVAVQGDSAAEVVPALAVGSLDVGLFVSALLRDLREGFAGSLRLWPGRRAKSGRQGQPSETGFFV